MAQTLGSVAVGSIVKLNESGSPVEYLVVQQGKPSSMYDDSCDGTWLLRKDVAENRVWDSGNSNVLESSDIQAYLNGTWLTRYDTNIQNAIKQVKIPYCVGGGSATVNSGANGLSCKIFLLSGYEVGFTTSVNQYFPVDGAKLAYFLSGNDSSANQKRVATLNGGDTGFWWTRSPHKESTDDVSLWIVNRNGQSDYWQAATPSCGVRPALVFPEDISVLDDGTVSTAPQSPATLTVPSIVMQGQGIPISWSQADGADGYILERKADSGAWTQVYSGANLSYADTAGSWSTVQYRVKAGADGTYGDYTTSAAVQVAAASALVISGQDGSLGTVTADIPYTVSTDTGNQISLVQTVNGAQMYSGQVTSGAARSIPVMELPSGNGTIVLTATVQTSGGPVSVARTWTYNKTPISFPASGGVAQLTKSGANLLPKTLAEAVRTNPFWGGSLDKALDKLTRAVTYAGEQVPRYQEVTVNLPAAQEGDIVQLPEGGKLVEFYVAKLNYEQALNGAGRTLLVRKDIWERNTWGLDTSGTYDGSDIDIRLNGTYKNSLGSDVQAAMGTTTFYCTENAVSDEVIPLSKAVFALSLTELGWNAATANAEGSELPIAGTLQIAMYEGDAIGQWTRSPDITDTGRANLVTPQGKASTQRNETTFGYRPCFTLPSTFTATYYVDGNGALHDAQEYDQAGDFYDLLGNVVPSVKIATGSYVGTGTSGESTPNSLIAPFSPKAMFIVPGGSHAGYLVGIWLGGDRMSGQIGEVGANIGSNVMVEGNKISWYSTGGPWDQFNASPDAMGGAGFYYLIFG